MGMVEAREADTSPPPGIRSTMVCDEIRRGNLKTTRVHKGGNLKAVENLEGEDHDANTRKYFA
jgi:hypothetical protein